MVDEETCKKVAASLRYIAGNLRLHEEELPVLGMIRLDLIVLAEQLDPPPDLPEASRASHFS